MRDHFLVPILKVDRDEATLRLFKAVGELAVHSRQAVEEEAAQYMRKALAEHDLDAVHEVARAIKTGRPHQAMAEYWNSTKAGRPLSEREIAFQKSAATAARALEAAGFLAKDARKAVAQIVERSGWGRKVSAEVIRGWQSGRRATERQPECIGRLSLDGFGYSRMIPVTKFVREVQAILMWKLKRPADSLYFLDEED